MPRSSDNWNNDKSTSDSDGFGYSRPSDGGGAAWGDTGESSNGGVPPKYGYQPNGNSRQPGSGNAAAKDANYDVTETTEFQPSPPGHLLLSKDNMGRPRMVPKDMGRATRRGMVRRNKASTSSRINIRRNTGKANSTTNNSTPVMLRMDLAPVPRRSERVRGHRDFRSEKF